MMTIMMMMVVIGMMMMMKINFLSGTMAIKNAWPRKHKLKKNSYPLLGTHQDIGIGACQKMRKRDRKIVGINMNLFVFDDWIQKSFGLKELKIKMSSVLNVSNDSDKPEEFSIKDIEVFVDSEEQKWFKGAHVGKFVGLEDIRTSLNGLEKSEMLTRQELIPSRCASLGWSGPKDQQNKTDKFLSVFGAMYTIVNSQKDKGKMLKKHILKDIVPHGFDARTEEIQEKH